MTAAATLEHATHSTSTPTAVREATASGISKRARITGRVLTGLVSAFLLMDVSFKFMSSPEVSQTVEQLGYRIETMPAIGCVLLACLVIHLIPRTAVLGAVLLTGYLGGAIATHVRVGNPLASHVLFPIYVAAFIWGGLYLRDVRARAMIAPASRS
jgi:hypothetical protein